MNSITRSAPATPSAAIKSLRGPGRSAAAPQATLRRLPWLLAAAGLCSLPAFAQMPANTLPAGGSVSAGSAVISQAGTAMRIDQATPRAVIDWQSFSIGSNASVTFNQPSASAITLNRVGPDGGRSIIDGRLSANGQVWLLNPSGALVGPTARIDVGGLLLTSQQLANDDFLNGNYRFSKGGDGSIVNQGRITAADGGYVALLAPEVRNEGVISARLGTVALASGDELRVDFSGDRLIEIKVDQSAVNGLIENRNLVEAEGGWVLMSTGAAGDLAGAAINISGVVRAASLTEHAGVIRLTGGDITVSGTLDVSSAAAQGGRIDVSGDDVELTGATLDASGAAGGGLVRIGGEFQGGKTPTLAADLQQSFVARWNGAPALSNAATTSIDAGTTIDISSGGGAAGTAIVWSGQETTFLGAIDASGVGPGVGNGGSVEISSAGNYRQVGLTGISGARSLLLDPKDITISSTASGTGSILSAGDIAATLSLGTAVTLLASNDLTWLSGNDINVNNASGDGGAVILQAGRSIVLNSSIATDNGSFSATANETTANGVVSAERNPGAANITMASGTSINAGTGSVSLTVQDAAQTGRATGYDTAGDITLANVSAATSLKAHTTGTLVTRSGSQLAAVSAGTPSTVVLQADQMDLQGTISADGWIALNVATAGRDIRLSDGLSGPPAAGGTTALDIDQDEIGRISGQTVASGKSIWIGNNAGGGGSAAPFSPVSPGNLSGNLTVAAPITVDRALTLFGNNITVNGAFSTSAKALTFATSGFIGLYAPTSAGDIWFSVGGGVIQTSTAPVTATTLLATGGGTVGLAGASGGNSIQSVAADVTGSFRLVNDATPLSIATVLGISGIRASDAYLATGGDLTLAQNITTTATSVSAIILNAGLTTAAGTATGGNIVISGSPTLTTGSGGRVTLYTGSVSGSTGLTALVGAGSGRFRYGSDQSLTNYSDALGTGLYAIYRERPVLSITADATAVYGTAPTLTAVPSGLVNGDTAAQAISTAATLTVGGGTSSSGHYTAGSHTLTASGAAGGLGYAFNYTDGTLTVNKASLTLAGFDAKDKTYDTSRSATINSAGSLSGVLSGDLVTASNGGASFADKTAGSGKIVTLIDVALAGSDAGNYTIASTATDTATITPASLFISGVTAQSKVYDATTAASLAVSGSVTPLSGDSVSIGGTGGSFADKNVGSRKTVTAALTLTGTDAGNYLLIQPTGLTADITAKSLTYAGTVANKVYDGTTTATVTDAVSGVIAGDAVTTTHSSAEFEDAEIGTRKLVMISGIALSGTDGKNYLVSPHASAEANITEKVAIVESPASSATTITETVVSQQSSASTTSTITVVAPTAAATTAPGGTGSGGATMDNFVAPAPAPAPAPAKTETVAAATSAAPEPPPPPPKLIVDASKSVPKSAGVLSRTELQAMNQQVHEARTQLFTDALALLAKDPRAADIAECANGGSEMCIAKAEVKVEEGYTPVVKRKIALLIGNNAYRSPIPALDTPIGDVTDIGAQLRDTLGYEVKVVQNAGRGEIVDALNDLIKNTDRDDSVLVMYAGHGYLQESTKTGYWIPTDATTSSPDKWISNDTIARALGNIPAKQVMLVSDSCYSGSLTKEGKAIETVGVNREQALTRRSVLAMSSGGEEPVSDEGRDNHSIFAWNMIQSIKQMTNETSGQQLHARIKAAVAKDEYPQVPQYGTVVSAGHAEGGEYLLTPKKN